MFVWLCENCLKLHKSLDGSGGWCASSRSRIMSTKSSFTLSRNRPSCSLLLHQQDTENSSKLNQSIRRKQTELLTSFAPTGNRKQLKTESIRRKQTELLTLTVLFYINSIRLPLAKLQMSSLHNYSPECLCDSLWKLLKTESCRQRVLVIRAAQCSFNNTIELPLTYFRRPFSYCCVFNGS